MKLISALHVAAAAAALVLCLPPAARAESCEDLWYARNQLYKAGGYCFRTARAIQAFGNAGCQYDDVNDVPLSARQRRILADIVGQERVQGCR